MQKILIAIDDSESSMKAVNHAADYFSGTSDLKVTLLNILPELQTLLWDDGHILNGNERAEREKTIKLWKKNKEIGIKKVFKAAVDTLIKCGFKPEQIETKLLLETDRGVAGCILEEAREGGYHTILLGRRSHLDIAGFLMGSVSTKVVNHGTGLSVCVIE
jgi:nucleotide-binding universal stress UspA family protein